MARLTAEQYRAELADLQDWASRHSLEERDAFALDAHERGEKLDGDLGAAQASYYDLVTDYKQLKERAVVAEKQVRDLFAPGTLGARLGALLYELEGRFPGTNPYRLLGLPTNCVEDVAMTDRAEAPERLSDQLIELWASRPELQVGVPYRSMATEAARLAAQERDAAVAAALEEAIECVRFVAREGANIGAFPQLREVAMLELVERTLEEWGEHQAIGCIRALPRNVDALRKHEAKLLRERDKLYCTALISSGLTVDQIHTIASRFNDLRPADDPVRDEAARREGTA